MSRRWRPSLGFVLGGALFGTLSVTFLGLVIFRYVGADIGFRNAAYLVGGAIAALTAVLGWLLVRLLLRPITALERFAQAVESSPRDAPAPPAHYGTVELQRTAQSVMAMAESLRNREATVRSYTDHVTHEIKSPVTALKAAVELLEDGADLKDSDRTLVAQIAQAGAKIEAQLDSLREAARARETRYDGVSTLAEVVPQLATEVEFHVEGGQVKIGLSCEGLADVLTHLVSNAAAHGARQMTLRAAPESGRVRLDIRDDGTGISPGNAARVFEPFFTTRRETGGTGMGLSIVASILQAHGGRISVEAAEQGAHFKLDLSGG